jgi:hypothetical protein
MLLHTFPHAAHVPWAYTGNPLSASWSVELARIGLNFGWKRLERMRARLLGNGQPLAEQFRDLQSELRADIRIRELLLSFAAADTFPDAVFDREGVLDTVRRHWNAGEDQTQLVSSLATFAVCHRLFLLSPPGEMPASADPVCGYEETKDG